MQADAPLAAPVQDETMLPLEARSRGLRISSHGRAFAMPVVSLYAVLVLSSLIGPCSADSPVDPQELPSLVQVYQSLDPANVTHWNTTIWCSNWYGVTCDNNGFITEINLAYLPLSGSLSAAISGLSTLNTLVARNVSLSGSVPNSLLNLTNLSYLDLSHNYLAGAVPKDLLELPKLSFVLLGTNNLSGHMPDVDRPSPLLVFLSLRSNNFELPERVTGSITFTLDIYNNSAACQALDPNLGSVCAWTPDPFCSALTCKPNYLADTAAFQPFPQYSPHAPGLHLPPPPFQGGNHSALPRHQGQHAASVSQAAGWRARRHLQGGQPGGDGPSGGMGGLPWPSGTCLCSDPLTSYLQLSNAQFWSFSQPLAQQLQSATAVQLTAALSARQRYTIFPQQVWVQSAQLQSLNSTARWLVVLQVFGNFSYSQEVAIKYALTENSTFLGPSFGTVTALKPPPAPPPPPSPFSPEDPHPLYSPPQLAPAPQGGGGGPKTSTSTLIIIIVSILVGCILLGALLMFLIFRFCRPVQQPVADISKDMPGSAQAPSSGDLASSSLRAKVEGHGPRYYSLAEVAACTGNWDSSNLLGQGGYGKVYLGKGPDEVQWAVKRVEGRVSEQALNDFKNEVELIARASHRNVVKLLGYCDDDMEQILIYEFVPNGNLRQHLRPSSSSKNKDRLGLSFEQRVTVAVGAAEGLRYLHEFTTPAVVHRDIKSENILLDENLEAKIADFGFFKTMEDEKGGSLGGRNRAEAMSTRVLGTPGYVDPEYYFTCKVTTKSDVYSFGIVLWELITGESPILEIEPNSQFADSSLQEGDPCFMQLPQFGAMYMKEGRLEDIADPKLKGQFDKEALYAMAEVAAECTKEKSRQRPDMTVVLTRLVELQLKMRQGEEEASVEPSRELSMDVRLRQEDLKHWMMPEKEK